MKRPLLNRIPLNSVDPGKPGQLLITMSVGQWDHFLQEGYEFGAVLLELDRNERPIAAYQKKEITLST